LRTQLADGSGGDLATPKVTRIKVCCVASVEEMQMAVHYGASAVGIGFGDAQRPGESSQKRSLPRLPSVDRFLLARVERPPMVIDQQRRTKTSVIQLCDRMAAEARRNSIGNWNAFGSRRCFT
jgi:phosphoribosylanthranilate isomerase